MAIVWDRSVYSSMVTGVAYDDETNDLIITWKNGRKSAYNGVPEPLAEQLSRAPSVGQMINSEIKPFFPHRYV